MHTQTEINKKWSDLKRKCDFYFSRIIAYPLSPPEHLYLSLTTRCNLKCLMCGVSIESSSESDELSTAECKRLIDQSAGLGIGHLIFSGGEPLLRRDIFDLIEYAVSKDIAMVDIITNGLLIDDGAANNLTRIGLNHITVALDGLEGVHNGIRGEGSYRRTVQAIDFVNKHRKNRLPTVGINFTIMDCNIDQILPVITLALEKRCNSVVLQPVLSDNTDMRQRKKGPFWVSEANIPKLRDILNEVLEIKRASRGLSIHVNEKVLKLIPDYFSGAGISDRLECYEGIVRMVVTHSGDLWTCLGVIGNIRKKALKSCWLSFEAERIRKEAVRCKEHCLQSCVHLPELSDIYLEAGEFANLIRAEGAEDSYLKKLLILFKGYRRMLIMKKWNNCFANIFRSGTTDTHKNLNDEIMLIPEVIKKLGLNIVSRNNKTHSKNLSMPIE